ncbi:hypothetical protein ACJJTC_015015 [Scirpophaga incertulas]
MGKSKRKHRESRSTSNDSKHRDGSKMSHVDALSPNPINSELPIVSDIEKILNIGDDTWLQTVQQQDSDVQRIISILDDPKTKDIENKFNKSRKAPKQYQVGDLVRIEKDIRTESGHSRKLLPKCIGPYRISKVLGNDRYEIVETPITRKNAVRAYKAVYAVDKMHPWLSFDNDVISSESE